jgi:hypothetical protein
MGAERGDGWCSLSVGISERVLEFLAQKPHGIRVFHTHAHSVIVLPEIWSIRSLSSTKRSTDFINRIGAFGAAAQLEIPWLP